MSNKYIIDITTLRVKRGREIKPLRPNADGIFENVPAFILGKGSRSTDYDSDSIVESINRPNSTFQMKVQEGNCEGEVGHPLMTGDPEKDLRRLIYIDRARLSHVIHGIHTVPLNNGEYLGTVDIKPSGSYAQFLTESLMDNTINTAFSMRTFCHPPKMQDNGRYYKRVKEFITIDFEGTPGWEEASKRFSPMTGGTAAMESFNQYSGYCSVANIVNVMKTHTELGFESRNNQLFDILQSDSVVVEDEQYVIDVANRTMISKTGQPKNIFHTFFKG